MLLYSFIKFRGYKTISQYSFPSSHSTTLTFKFRPARFFPHEIADLTITLDYVTSPDTPAKTEWEWALRYALLLWLSLVCMIPFDLEQFDEEGKIGETASRVEGVGKMFIDKAGLDRESAAILLSRFYMR